MIFLVDPYLITHNICPLTIINRAHPLAIWMSYITKALSPSHSGFVDVMDYQTPFPLRTKRFTKRPVSMTTPSLSGFTDPTYGYVDVVDYPLPPSMGFVNKRTSRVKINSPYSGSGMLAVSARPYSERSLHLPKQ